MEKQAVCAVILAAGQSTRMGKTKQILKLGDKCILEHVIEKVVKQTFDQIFVVIGHEAEKVQESISVHSDRVQWLVNNQFKLGQSTSFLSAISHMNPLIKSAMFFLGDQPFIKSETITTILNKGKTMGLIEASPFIVRPYHQQSPGHPIFWGNLKQLDFTNVTGDEGGKSLFSYVKQERLIMKDPEILFDIDTPESYQMALRKMEV